MKSLSFKNYQMNPFLLRPDERLSDWKDFRNSLPSLSEEEQLKSVAEYWSKAPLLKIAYDPDDATNWLTPWEMIHAGQWCRHSVAIGMESTLRLSGWDTNRLTLQLIIDRNISDMFLILNIDDKWFLNYDWGSVLERPTTPISVIREWRFDGHSYTQI